MEPLLKRYRFYKELKRLAGEKVLQGEPLSVMDDLVFKAMLTSDSEDSRKALHSLLSACTRRQVSDVQVTNNDLVPAYLEAKAVRLDVHVIFNDGETADLEMQMSKTYDDLIKRAETYTAILLSGQSKKGHYYKEVKRVYQIFFLNFVLFPGSGKLPRRYSYREETEHDRLSDVTEIIFYELPKLERRVQELLSGKGGEKIVLSDEEKWCMYMKYRHDERAAKLVERLYRDVEGIMWAERAVKGIDRDYLKFARNMAIEKNRLDRGQMIAELKDKIRAEGLAEGKLEIARKMKEIGLPITQITEITGLAPEAIEKITNE